MTKATGAATKSEYQSLLSLHDKKKYFERKKYFKAVDNFIRDWKESAKGVVVGLRYDENNHKFIAKARYIDERKDNCVVEETFDVTDDWVFENYGPNVSSKLMKRAQNKLFSELPVTTNGTLGDFMVDRQKILKVRFLPPTQRTRGGGDRNRDLVTKVTRLLPARWQGLREDGQVVLLREEDLRTQFGGLFVEEIKMLGHTQFVYVPVGGTRQSVMEIMPRLKDPWAPVVKFQQGELDTCVFSSMASALHSSGDFRLQRVANTLHQKRPRHVGATSFLQLLMQMVQVEERCLQPK